jgi:hypothetical protein
VGRQIFDRLAGIESDRIRASCLQQLGRHWGAPVGVNAGAATGATIYMYACWVRALTQAEAALLSTDPYCFLIWPEDDLYARLMSGHTLGRVPYNPLPQWAPLLMH